MKIKNTIIIAEAGVNHNGSMKIAKQLIKKASDAKVNFIKFQSFSAENLATTSAQKTKYQKKTTNKKETQFNMLKKLQINLKQHKKLIFWCEKYNVGFLSSVFGIESFNMLYDLGQRIIKIPSGEINNLPLLEHISKKKVKIILSTGMSSISEVKDAIKILTKGTISKKNITILHCTSQYPAPFDQLNLRAINTLNKNLNINVGYSDHSIGIEAPIAAVALGAQTIEKHFTLDKKMNGPDHAASIEPDELSVMVKNIRNIEKSLGNGKKRIQQTELMNINIIRKSIVAKKQIKKGELFTSNNLTVKRPGIGISPLKWHSIIGKRSKFNFKKDDLIKK